MKKHSGVCALIVTQLVAIQICLQETEANNHKHGGRGQHFAVLNDQHSRNEFERAAKFLSHPASHNYQLNKLSLDSTDKNNKHESSKPIQNTTLRDSLMGSASTPFAPQFDDEPESGINDLGLASSSHTLNPSNDQRGRQLTPQFNWLLEQVQGRARPSNITAASHLASMKLLGANLTKSKYQNSTQRALDSIHSRSLNLGQIDRFNSTKSLHESDQWRTASGPGQRWQPEEKTSGLDTNTRDSLVGASLREFHQQASKLLLRSDVRVTSDPVLVKDQVNVTGMADTPIKTLSQKVVNASNKPIEVMDSANQVHPAPGQFLIISGNNFIRSKPDKLNEKLQLLKPLPTMSLSQMLRRQAELLDSEEAAAKRTSDEEEEIDDEQLNSASSSNSLENFRANPSMIRATGNKLSSAALDVHRKFGLASFQASKGTQMDKKQQQLKEAASIREIKVTIGDGTRPVFMNSRGLIMAAKKNATGRPNLHNPSKLFAESLTSFTLDPLEMATKEQHGVRNKNTNSNNKRRPIANDPPKNNQANSWLLSPSLQQSTTNASTVTLEPLATTTELNAAAFVHDGGNQLDNWPNGNQFQATTNKRNNSSSGGIKVSLDGHWAADQQTKTPASTKYTGVNALASSLVGSLMDLDEQQSSNWTRPHHEMGNSSALDGSSEEPHEISTSTRGFTKARPTTTDRVISATTSTVNFNHNPPYKLHSTPSFVETVTQTSVFDAESYNSSSLSIAPSNNRKSTRPNNRFHGPDQDTQTSATSTVPIGAHNRQRKRPTTPSNQQTSEQTTTNSPLNSTPLSSIHLNEPVNTLYNQHLLVQHANQTAGAMKPGNKIRINLRNMLLNKFIIKPLQQQQHHQQTHQSTGQQQQQSQPQTASVGSPLLSNPAANNMAQLLALKLSSLVRPHQSSSPSHAPPHPGLNSLFGFRVPSSSQHTTPVSSNSNGPFSKLKQRVSLPFGPSRAQAVGNGGAGLGLSHRRNAGVGSLLFSGLIYGLTVLPALMAITGINPLSSLGVTDTAGSIGQTLGSAANRNQGGELKARPRPHLSQLGSGGLGGDLADSFAYLMPLLSSAMAANEADSGPSENSALMNALSRPGLIPPTSSQPFGDDPQSSALRALYAPPPTVLEPVRGGIDLGNMINESPDLDWAAYVNEPSRKVMHDRSHTSPQQDVAIRLAPISRHHRDLSASNSDGGWRTRRQPLGSIQSDDTAVFGQPSMGPYAFMKSNGTRDEVSQRTKWSAQLEELKQVQDQLERQRDQILNYRLQQGASSNHLLIQSQPAGLQSTQLNHKAHHDGNPFDVDPSSNVMPFHDEQRRISLYPKSQVVPARWNVGTGEKNSRLNLVGGQKVQSQQVVSLVNAPQHANISRPASANVPLGDDLAIIGQFNPAGSVPWQVEFKTNSPTEINLGGGLRHRRTVINQQPPSLRQPSAGLSESTPFTKNDREFQEPPQKLEGGWRNNLTANRSQTHNEAHLQSDASEGVHDQRNHMLSLMAPQSIFPTREQNKSTHNSDHYQGEDNQDKLNSALKISQTAGEMNPDLRSNSHIEQQRWSSTSDWQAIAPPSPRWIVPTHTNNLGTPLGDSGDISTRDDIETVVGRLPDHEPINEREVKQSKKKRSNSVRMSTRRKNPKANGTKTKVKLSNYSGSIERTTKAPFQRLDKDRDENELILAHSMAMGSRVLNEPFDIHHNS